MPILRGISLFPHSVGITTRYDERWHSAAFAPLAEAQRQTF
ncbi:hypothetical protein [Klebsiella quasipneumoniae]|nr:hypothetical protein [Klebsiella quasipneumoniae]MDA5091726.1 hypothetical protein [Klebsiella quasipneumoniae subsp. quasipneumoniae]MDD9214569.1 hypothetical protein [Klebsiella quasipneumoniae]